MSELTNSNQYLTFTLDQEVFGLEIGKVREVLDYTTLTKVPQAPEFMRGVINLRGSVVPVVDMRLKFGMTLTRRSVNTCIIIVEVELGGEKTLLGALADSVREVMDLNAEDIEPAPKIGIGLNTEFIKGMGKAGEKFIILLDFDRVFSFEELSVLRESPNETEAA